MNKLLLGISIFLSLEFNALAQTANYIAVSSTEEIPWEAFHPTDKRFIIAGEAYQVACVYPFHLSHLKWLVTKGFRHLVWEVPYSFSFIGDRYINTGNDSLLRYITFSRESLAWWRAVYALNQSLAEGDKIRLWGIDHELGNGSPSSLQTFQKAVSLMMEGKGALPPSLEHEMDSLLSAKTMKELKGVKQRIRQRLKVLSSYFGKDLAHFTLLINRVDFPNVNRNQEMVKAFREICTTFHLDSRAKFLGRFGWGHTDKSSRQSISWLLENDPSSPVKGSIYVIGVHYLRCTSSISNSGLLLNNVGIVSAESEKKKLVSIDHQTPAPIKIFQTPLDENKKGWTRSADVLFLFSGYPGVTILKRTI